ncbi:MAG: alginate export family protein [Gammaproteobacteria bacterium]|nr:alginate export family protein [Gammaproteobacteria bacterium]
MKIPMLNTVGGSMIIASGFVPLQAFAGFAEGMQQTKPSFNIRYRMETVDQDGIDNNARASTAKARASWIMTSNDGFSVGLESDFVFLIGDERYNSTANGLTEYPVVADPTGVDLNQAFLRYRDGSLMATMGRQRILHGSQRFVGGVAWRQNEQTYDALRVQSIHDTASFDYSYVANVNRIFGPEDGAQPADWEGNSHLFRVAVKPVEGQEFGSFVYLMNFENDNGPPNANRTYGVDYTASFGAFSLFASVAQQSDWADNPNSYDAAYYAIEGRMKSGPATYTLGYEVLGSDEGMAAFRTPIATLHKFQGWTDKFLGTPAGGIRDSYLKAATKVGPASFAIALHNFSAVEGGADYGREVDLSFSCPIGERLNLLFKFARYNAQDHATDTTKGWLVITYSI